MRHPLLFALVWFGVGALSAQNATVHAGAGIHLVGSGKLILQGNLTNNGNVQSADQSALRFVGDARSAISGSGGTVLQDLQLAKSNESVELLQSLTVNGTLEFVNDANYLLCADDTLTLGPNAGGIVGADANNYVVTNGEGALLKKQMAVAFFYPVGFDQSTYNPVALANTGGAEDLGIRCREQVLTQASTGTPAVQGAAEVSWDLIKPQSNGANLSVDLTWTGADELPGFNRALCFVGQFRDGNWDVVPPSAATGSDPYTTTRQSIATGGTLGVFSKTPTVANAGSDAGICAANSIPLSANTPARGTGTWSVQSGTDGTFGDAHAPNTTFSGVLGQAYSLLWTIDDPLGPWLSSTDAVNVVFGIPSTAEAGENQSVCANGMATLAASGSNGTGIWSIVGGPSTSAAQLSDPTAANAVFTPMGGAGTYALRWTVSNPFCPPATDEMAIEANALPTIALASAPNSDHQTICAGASVNILYNVAGGATAVVANGLPNGLSGSFANGVFAISGSSTALGIHNYNLTTVGCTPAATATGSVAISPNMPPTIACPPAILRYVDPGTCTATVAYPDPTYSDNCFSVTLSKLSGPASGTSLTKGSHQAIWQATQNGGGLTAQCTVNITVVDNILPAIACPPTQTRNTDLGQCTALVIYNNPTATDNCNTPAPTVMHVSGGTGTAQGASTSSATFPKGITAVQWKAIDGVGLTKTCTFRVVVNDLEAPTLTCPTPAPVNAAPGLCNATVTYANPTFADNCPPTSGTSVRISGPASGSAFPVGNTNVTFQATDAASNTKRCTMTVTVTDNQPPVVSCPPSVAVAGSGSSCAATVFYANATATDNCAGSLAPFLLSGLASGSSFPTGVTTNTWQAIAPNGQSASCAFTVTVTCGSLLGDGAKNRDAEVLKYSNTQILNYALFPNPAAHEAWLDLSALEGRPCALRLLDVRGALVQRYPAASGLFRLDLDGLPTGLYLVQVRAPGQKVQVLKLVVERG